MHRAGPGERGGGSYGQRAVATAKWAAMQISGVGKGIRLGAEMREAQTCANQLVSLRAFLKHNFPRL